MNYYYITFLIMSYLMIQNKLVELYDLANILVWIKRDGYI
jgi:hypothetical protein